MNPTRSCLALVAALGLAACARAEAPSATPSSSIPPSAAASESSSPQPTATIPSPASTPAPDALLATVLLDVRDGEEFTLAELSEQGVPVLLEPMAVWCTTCRAQQHEVTRAHDAAEFVSVSLDVDLSERAADLAAYADREGFGWRFAMADGDLYRMLQERFGIGATNPPLTPLIVIEPGGTVRALEFGQGVRSAEQLLDALGLG